MEGTRLNVVVPKDLLRRAEAVAALQGHSLSEIVQTALEDYIEEMEDVAIVKETMARIKRGEERTYSHDEVWAEEDARLSML